VGSRDPRSGARLSLLSFSPHSATMADRRPPPRRRGLRHRPWWWALVLALALPLAARAQPRLLTAALDAASEQLSAWVQSAYGADSVPIRTPADVRALLTLPSGG